MDPELFGAVEPALREALGMFGVEVERIVSPDRDDVHGANDFIATIALQGESMDAVLHLLVTATAAEELVASMLGAPSTNDATTSDGLGEIANLAAGGIKTRLEPHNLSLGLPSVIQGRSLRLAGCVTCASQADRFRFASGLVVDTVLQMKPHKVCSSNHERARAGGAQ
ncbi:MAG: chemotaxis protein CheX [Planctomycetota bacterium]